MITRISQSFLTSTIGRHYKINVEIYGDKSNFNILLKAMTASMSEKIYFSLM